MAVFKCNFDLNHPPNESPTIHLDELPNSSSEVLEINLNVIPIQEEEEEFDANPINVEVEGDEPLHIGPSNEEQIHAMAGHENVDMSQHEGQKRSYRSISSDERKMIYNALLERSANGKLKNNTTKEVSSLFSVPLRSVQRIWKRAKESPSGSPVDLRDRRPKNSGRKRVELDLNRIADIPLNKRTTLRSLAHSLNVSHVTVHSRFKEGQHRRHSNSVKPYLTEAHKMARLRFCISMLETNSLSRQPKFIGMYNFVHIDEKWFYMTKKTKSYYLLANEEDPLRSCKSKNYIGKVMFITAVARPRFDEDGNEVFSGKIGLFPLVNMQPALRSSRNREVGTIETKPITSVTKDIIRTFLIEKVIPAIEAKWPIEDRGSTIFIQQDNARTHVRPNDEEFQRAASNSGFDIRLLYQPANSPDMNVLDLGFFREIEALQQKERTNTVDELIGSVYKAFEEYPAQKINRIFLSLQYCMRETMTVQGSNRYKIPHSDKDGLERKGLLQKQILCPHDLVENTMNILG